jgi:phage shock protein PspC (stress-responsive transcriptional regulator)
MRIPRIWIALSIAGVITLAGCSAETGNDESAMPASDSRSGSDEAPAAGAPADQGVDEGAVSEADEPATDQESVDLDETRGSTPTSEGNLTEAGMVFVTTATVGVQVEDPYPVLDQVADYAVDAGGGEVDRTFQAATEHEGARGSVTVKLPPLEMNTAIEHLSTYGEVKSVDLHREDISVSVTDLESRIRVAQMSVDRMEQWLATATTREEAFELERMYNERLVELENLLSQQRAETHDTALSTLTVEVYSPEAAPPPEPEPEPEPETGFIAGLTNGWNNFYEWGSDVLRVLGVLLPWLVFLVLLVVAAYYIAKPLRKRLDSRPPRPGGPTTTIPPLDQPVAQRTAPAQPGPGHPSPAPQPKGAQRPTASQLLDTRPGGPAPADAPKKSGPPAPPPA